MGNQHVLGLDWIGGRHGWGVCRLELHGEPGAIELKTLAPGKEGCSLVRQAGRIVIDAPIGLPDGCRTGCKLRDCDRAAKRWIGKELQSSVFPAPCAGELAEWRRRRAAGLPQQRGHFRGLLPAIHSADIIRSLHPETLESHPELAFAALAGRPLPAFAAKTTLTGALVRLGLLAGRCGIRLDLSDLARFGRIGAIDFIDAAAMAVVAAGWQREGDVPVLRSREGDPEPLGRRPDHRDMLMALPADYRGPRDADLLAAEEVAAIGRAWSW
jgi:predicted RNase H-like nuclease